MNAYHGRLSSIPILGLIILHNLYLSNSSIRIPSKHSNNIVTLHNKKYESLIQLFRLFEQQHNPDLLELILVIIPLIELPLPSRLI